MWAIIRYNLGDRDGVKEDTTWLLERGPEGINVERVKELRRLAEEGELSWRLV
jgi:hypothetical protein